MANEQNLRPFSKLTESEQREIAQKGGIASGAVRREKKKIKEVLEILLSMPDNNSGIDNREAICLALLNQAKTGDAQAFKIIRDTIGEKPRGEIDNFHHLADSSLVDLASIQRLHDMLSNTKSPNK